MISMEEQTQGKKLLLRILFTALLTGSIDALFVVLPGCQASAAAVFRCIASGVFDTKAFTGGKEMVYYGVLFHYYFALAWTVAFLLFYPALFKITKIRAVLILLTGMVIWLVMNFIIVPLSHIPTCEKGGILRIVKNLGVLILAYGLPFTIIADRYGKTNKAKPLEMR